MSDFNKSRTVMFITRNYIIFSSFHAAELFGFMGFISKAPLIIIIIPKQRKRNRNIFSVLQRTIENSMIRILNDSFVRDTIQRSCTTD